MFHNNIDELYYLSLHFFHQTGLFYFFQVTKTSLYRPEMVLRLSQLQVLDGVMVTLEETTRAELTVRTAHNTHVHSGTHRMDVNKWDGA